MIFKIANGQLLYKVINSEADINNQKNYPKKFSKKYQES